MAKVRIKGLNIRRNASGTWYAHLRATGQQLAKAGSREELQRVLETPQFLTAYVTAERKRKRTYDAGTLGAMVERYRSSRRYIALAERTRSDYEKVLLYLDKALDMPVAEIEPIDIIETRDKAAADKGDKFSDFVLAVLSAVFREGVESGLVKSNPVLGIGRLYRANAEANRRWTPEEWSSVSRAVPEPLRAVVHIAYHCGLRGQDIAALKWENYRTDPDMGKVLAFTPKKNGAKVGELTIGVPMELRKVLDAMRSGSVIPASNSPICRSSHGKAYKSESTMRGAWQAWKQSDEFKTAVPTGADLTLHGLRVTYASQLRERGFTDREVADMLGDLSEGMGKRYSRGAEMRKTSVRVFKRLAE
ncbi:MAG: hypothetical protein RLZZ09_816 [Pseudomonadota bacterium]